ncbi:hypothetical protein DEU32_11410 [Curtobacterium sp. AG1037]|uniref:winged helix-turn-helix domain-containing protein n=1 Tax=Curtobacterium sp. AG1037 TaxID=2183990 RepID=UPI000E0C2E9B|nr:winged helix-turn-helix domain-containing protein [Curtobacterium sp. AG1037]RDH95045.1 hypothetical protein DEU32_11410 [Curtobacterium sp. AG1037]
MFSAAHARGEDPETLRHAVAAAVQEAEVAWSTARVVMSQAVWSLLEQDPSLSVRAIATQLGMSKSEVDRVVRRFRNEDGSLEAIRFSLGDARGRDVVGVRVADFNNVRAMWRLGAERAVRSS